MPPVISRKYNCPLGMPGNKVDLEIGLIGNSTWHILGAGKMKANKTKNLQGKEWPIAEKYGCSRSEVRSQNRALKEGWTCVGMRGSQKKNLQLNPHLNLSLGRDDMAARVAKCHGSRRYFCGKHGKALKMQAFLMGVKVCLTFFSVYRIGHFATV